MGRAALADIDKKRRCQERAMGQRGDPYTGLLRSSAFRLALRRLDAGHRAMAEGLQVIEKWGQRGHGFFCRCV
jgi:hypothetical protein